MFIFTFIDPVAKQTQSPVKPTPSDKPILFGDVTCKLIFTRNFVSSLYHIL